MKDNYRKKPAFWNKHSYIIGFFKQNLQKRNHPHTPRKVKPRQCFKKLTNSVVDLHKTLMGTL